MDEVYRLTGMNDTRTRAGNMYTAQLEAADRQYMVDVIKCMQDELKGLLVDCDLKADKAITHRLKRLTGQVKSLNACHKTITVV